MSSQTRNIQRLSADPTKWPRWGPGALCKVFMGYGWASGVWKGLAGARGAVWLSKEGRMVYVGDARNVRAA